VGRQPGRDKSHRGAIAPSVWPFPVAKMASCRASFSVRRSAAILALMQPRLAVTPVLQITQSVAQTAAVNQPARTSPLPGRNYNWLSCFNARTISSQSKSGVRFGLGVQRLDCVHWLGRLCICGVVVQASPDSPPPLLSRAENRVRHGLACCTSSQCRSDFLVRLQFDGLGSSSYMSI
jgi:hypothetical protein